MHVVAVRVGYLAATVNLAFVIATYVLVMAGWRSWREGHLSSPSLRLGIVWLVIVGSVVYLSQRDLVPSIPS
jgi:hypothetical protein